MAGETASAVHAGKQSFDEVLDIVSKYFAPLGGVAAGFFFAGPNLGGAYTIGDLLWNGYTKAQPGDTPSTLGPICNFVGGAIFGTVFIGSGILLYRSGKSMAAFGQAICGFFGGLLAGWGAYALARGIGNSLNKGWIDQGISDLVGGD